MWGSIGSFGRLVHAGVVLARHGALDPLTSFTLAPGWARSLLRLFILVTAWRRPRQDGEMRPDGLAEALRELGPSYIKLGQFLATRGDLTGEAVRRELRTLQDKLPPFPQAEAIAAIEAELGGKWQDHYQDLSEPVAAASIAQVHFAHTKAGDPVAVKILRPGIEAAFARDLASFYLAARLAERLMPDFQRLKPITIVDTLSHWVRLEMDLRLEAAAACELAENMADDKMFRVPKVDWSRTARRILTLERIVGIPLSDLEAVIASGIDLPRLGNHIISTFLTQATRDGFFHGDMHQGNLFIDDKQRLCAVDFGIMGRLDRDSRRFLAEILYGFLEKDYLHVARVHFEAGYVPDNQSMATFAQALRSVGEPIFGQDSEQISMGRVLTQLFEVTETFGMETQPQLLLLQKTMVTVEGVARDLDPKANIWEAARPVIEDWMRANIGPEARLRDAADKAADLAQALPRLAEDAHHIARMAGPKGLRLDPDTANSQGPSRLVWFLIGAASLALASLVF